jgi:hypothetical protein
VEQAVSDRADERRRVGARPVAVVVFVVVTRELDVRRRAQVLSTSALTKMSGESPLSAPTASLAAKDCRFTTHVPVVTTAGFTAGTASGTPAARIPAIATLRRWISS